ncbi:MAG: LysM peptidoglycan-binding domain-containing protein, partial [SAR324 cluster bacterium]|nr:LysM peptidoglycan-binding domain-containing protein [SAR324 cluster bacterium]
WQFTRGTGRQFLTIRYEVDERLDPLLATEAAAKFLRQNYDRLGSWPLAITAYNHGPVGMQRIVNRLKTRDLAKMITDYDGRLFKFASKNFYAEFLAAREVATHYEKFFGELELKKPLAFRKVKLPFFLDFGAAVRVLGVKEKFLAELNPSLRMPVLVGAKHIPSGFHLRVPPHVHPKEFLRAIPANARADTQKRTFEIVVRRGDSLYSLGRRYKVPWRVIARANFITAYHRIRPGQRLMIPWRGQTGDWVAKRDDRAKAKTVPKTLVAAVIASRKAAPDKTREVGDQSIAFQAAEGASLFQDLEVRNFSTNAQVGEIVAAYGETLGHYAAWAGVSTQEIRDYNGFSYRRILKPGSLLLIPFHKMTPTAFNQQRFEYHHIRESDFYSSYGVTEVVKVKVRRGDSPWEIAQGNDVPMWLFYQSNPALIETGLRAGMTVSLPVIEALAVLEGPGEGGSAAPLN